MKELSIEEKAKAYDELFVKAKSWYIDAQIDFKKSLENLFPELAESEDERIRKELIKALKTCKWCGNKYWSSDLVSIDDALAWLEKQGEQKPVYHKFRVGDKVKKGYLTYTVEDINEESYKLQAYSKDGDKGSTVFLTIGYEKDYELVEQKSADWSEEDEKMCQETIDWFEKKCFPYAIEYENPARESIQWLKSLKGRVQPKPKEWSEEDDYNLQCMIAKVTSDIQKGNVGRNNELIDWLKSLRPQNTWRPSDEQMDALRYVTNFDYGGYKATLVSLYEQLKKLKA